MFAAYINNFFSNATSAKNWQQWHLGSLETIVSPVQMSFTAIQTIWGMESLSYKHHHWIANIHQRRAVIDNMAKWEGEKHTHIHVQTTQKKVRHRLGKSIYLHNLKHNVTATNIFLKMHSLLHWGWNAEKCNKDTIIDQNPQIQPEYRHTQTLYKTNHNPADTVTWKPHVKYTHPWAVISPFSFGQLIHCRSDQKHSRQTASKFLYSHTDAAVAMRILV